MVKKKRFAKVETACPVCGRIVKFVKLEDLKPKIVKKSQKT
jgi:hypothetical protein